MGVSTLKGLGSEWQKSGTHRVYFNDLASWYGLSTSQYTTGNVASATLGTSAISNTQAKRIIARLQGGKVYYDVVTGAFTGQNVSQDDLDVIVTAIKAKANAAGAA